MYTIGQTSSQLGISAHTLRYYEKTELLPPVHKDAGGRRLFSPADIDRIKFIKRAQRMQFSLEEIRQLLNLDKLPTVPKEKAQAMVKTKLEDIEVNLKELARLKSDLSALLDQCLASSEDEDCPIIDGLKEK